MAKYENYARTIAYRFYIADSLKLIPQHGSLQKHLREIYYEKHVVDTRSGDEITTDIMNRAGLSFGR